MFLYKYYLEIKNRLFLILLSWILITSVCVFYKEVLLIFLIKTITDPLFHENLNIYFIFTDVKELFNVYFKAVFTVSNKLCAIIIIYHFFMFFYLGLYFLEYLKLKNIFKTFFISFLTSIFLSFNLVIPLSFFFFLGFQNKTCNVNDISFFFEAKISEYFDFFVQVFNLCFLSLQLVGFSFLFLNYFFKTINYSKIKTFRKLFYFVFISISTIITPPDVFSQVLLSCFLIFCYEFFTFVKIFSIIN